LTCERVIIIHQGRIVADSRLEDLTQERSLEEVFLSLVGFQEGES